MARRLEVLQELEAHAEPGNDAEYAALYESVGKLFIDQQNYPEALPYLEKAFSYKSDLISLPYNLVVA
jgi:tetratricopeptide (TPR) repeat protein